MRLLGVFLTIFVILFLIRIFFGIWRMNKIKQMRKARLEGKEIYIRAEKK